MLFNRYCLLLAIEMTYMPHQLEAKNLRKHYKSHQVVKDVSFTVKSGQIIGLLGPNGAGKTTAFYIMIGLIKADGGQIIFDNHPISHDSIHHRARKGITYLPQEASIFRKLTVADNIMAVLELSHGLNYQQRLKKLTSLMHEFRIQPIQKKLGLSLSGGERRRVEIARALATQPKFILLDEPFAGIDPISIIDIKQLITQLRDKNIGILITDHNVRETLRICEHAYIMSHGEVICSGSPHEILRNPKVREVYLGNDFTL